MSWLGYNLVDLSFSKSLNKKRVKNTLFPRKWGIATLRVKNTLFPRKWGIATLSLRNENNRLRVENIPFGACVKHFI